VAGKTSGYSLNNEKYVGKVYNEKYPETILEFSSRSKGNRGLHPTQKPIELLEYLIKTYTNEEDLVLDNCAGSGSTLVAAKNLNRQFIGIEKEKEYYDICLERLK
jgi:site-specific DNA-methyltransferase (adenine-specific)